jgi:hypothetical protein
MSQTPSTAQEFKWFHWFATTSAAIIEAEKDPKTETIQLDACMAKMGDILMMLPLMSPFSDAFVKQICLVDRTPLTYCHKAMQSSTNKLKFAFVLATARELEFSKDRVLQLAAATLSHLLPPSVV